MKIFVICSNKSHPIFPYLKNWSKEKKDQKHDVELVNNVDELNGGDILFLISCNDIIRESVRSKYGVCLVIHASDLPKGRGWSPHIWEILEGKNIVTVSLIEAEDNVDTGNIWKKEKFVLEGHELFDEINKKLFDVELKLMDFAINNYGTIIPIKQKEGEKSYYRKRNPLDSEIDPNKPISEQFDLLRVCDPFRYPSFFSFRGKRYKIWIEKIEEKS